MMGMKFMSCCCSNRLLLLLCSLCLLNLTVGQEKTTIMELKLGLFSGIVTPHISLLRGIEENVDGTYGIACSGSKVDFQEKRERLKKERDSKSYLDVEIVKEGSKLVLIEDIVSRERRIPETLKIAKKEKTSKSLTEINLEVNKLAKKVAVLEAAASTGGVIAELDVESLIANLMRMLITLDEIYGEGELKVQKREQVVGPVKENNGLCKLKVKQP